MTFVLIDIEGRVRQYARRRTLRADLHAATGLHVQVDKDVTAAATGERWAQGGARYHYVFCYLGSGVGAGVVMDDVWVPATTSARSATSLSTQEPRTSGLASQARWPRRAFPEHW